jgi:hypothetical protein
VDKETGNIKTSAASSREDRHLKKRLRPSSAQSLAEFLGALVFFVPVLLTVVDLAVITESVRQNRISCHSVARLLASGPPRALSPIIQQRLAEEAISRSSKTAFFEILPDLNITGNHWSRMATQY